MLLTEENEDCKEDECDAMHCVPFRCPQIPVVKYGGSVESSEFSVLHDQGSFVCKEDYFIPDLNTTTLKVVCKALEFGAMPVSNIKYVQVLYIFCNDFFHFRIGCLMKGN